LGALIPKSRASPINIIIPGKNYRQFVRTFYGLRKMIESPKLNNVPETYGNKYNGYIYFILLPRASMFLTSLSSFSDGLS
jgi:hypothetical protein